MESIQGRALVASPYLTDPNFLRSVVYILRHDEEGAIGLVLNRPLGTTIGELLEQLTEQAVDNSQPVFCGGPVDGPLMMLQCCRDGSEDHEVIYVASDQARITNLCGGESKSSSDRYRVFDGYSGWGAGQLESEMKQGGWLVWDATPDDIFSCPDLLWQRALRCIGRDILAGGIDPSRIPVDPAYN
jgi:putative transcriptional regulator